MTRVPQRLGDYLAHMLEAIERIEEYVSDMDERPSWGTGWSKTRSSATLKSLARPATTSKSVFLNLWPSIPSCRFHRLISCAMRLRMDISRWTLKSSGKPSTATYRACMP